MSGPQPQRGTPETLRHQLGRSLAAAGLALALIVIAAVYSLVQVMTHQSRITGLYFDAISYSEALAEWNHNAATAVQNYIDTGFEPTLDQYDATPGATFKSVRAELISEYGVDSSVVLAMDSAAARIANWSTTFAQPAIELVDANGPGSVPASLSLQGEALFDEAESAIHLFSTELLAGRSETADGLSQWTRNLFLTVVLLVIAALAVGWGTWFVLRRHILTPLADLAAKAEEVSSGSLDVAVCTEGPGEIASLAGAVDRMRVDLIDRMAAAKRSEAEIAHAHEQVIEQAEELRRSNRDLEQFAYVASHDLQEPLRKVASFTQLLQKRYGGELDERADQYIEFAVDGARRMQRLIQDLLGFSRVGRAVGPMTDVDLSAACETAIGTLDAVIDSEGATIEVAALPTVSGHEMLLVQLFQNLVGNALKFRHADRAPLVSIGCSRREASWEFWCADNGIGIDAQYAERVFVIFQRLHAKEAYEGTGIGLSLCKKIVEYHGGEIWIDVPPPDAVGTTVRWTLPDSRPSFGGSSA